MLRRLWRDRPFRTDSGNAPPVRPARARERERVCVCVRARVRVHRRGRVCVCVCARVCFAFRLKVYLESSLHLFALPLFRVWMDFPTVKLSLLPPWATAREMRVFMARYAPLTSLTGRIPMRGVTVYDEEPGSIFAGRRFAHVLMDSWAHAEAYAAAVHQRSFDVPPLLRDLNGQPQARPLVDVIATVIRRFQ